MAAWATLAQTELAAMIPAAAPATASPAQWYYASGGANQGPVTAEAIAQLVMTGGIVGPTPVWRDGMAAWTPLMQTELAALIPSPGHLPPPMARAPVNNFSAWFSALVPLIFGWLISLTREMSHSSLYFLIVPMVLSYRIQRIDLRYIRALGYDTEGLALWSFLPTPMYLYLRAQRLGQSNAPALAWLVSLAVGLLLFK
jgi:hypothetical protein